MQMERLFKHEGKYHCLKCKRNWISVNRIRNRPMLCQMCGIPQYPYTENSTVLFYIPNYRSISHSLRQSK